MKKEEACRAGTDISVVISRAFAGDGLLLPPFCLSKVCLADSALEETILTQQAGQVLSAAEMETFGAFGFPHRQREWLAGRLAVKEAVRTLEGEPQSRLRDIEVRVGERGRPFVATRAGDERPLYIAISHSGASALGLASRVPCALDFQEIRSALARVEDRFVRAEERDLVRRCHSQELRALGLVWAGKEALRKYIPLWPLLGFLEARLHGVHILGSGLVLSFQPQPQKRALPPRLPAVLATLYGDNALALIFAGSGPEGALPFFDS
ncbi:MAG: hypothetical protein RI601_07720 [Desulfurivibrionaceae bacterium]|nr:hypothetical protein [Desulfurivibrionaceae bacterium]